MSGPLARTVKVSARQRAEIESLVRASSTSQQLAQRCRVVLLAVEDKSNEAIGRELGVDRQLVRRWRGRWAHGQQRLATAENEGVTDKDLRALIVELLADGNRCGGPTKFTPEQVAGPTASCGSSWPIAREPAVRS